MASLAALTLICNASTSSIDTAPRSLAPRPVDKDAVGAAPLQRQSIFVKNYQLENSQLLRNLRRKGGVQEEEGWWGGTWFQGNSSNNAAGSGGPNARMSTAQAARASQMGRFKGRASVMQSRKSGITIHKI